MTETILYCFCNYCYITNIRKNKEINFPNTNKKCLKECFDNPPTDKIKLAAAIIICYFKLGRDKLSRDVEMYLRDIKEKHFLKSSERYLGIKEELIMVALDKNKDMDQKRTQSKMRLKEEEFDYTKMSKQEIYEALKKKSFFFKLLETENKVLKNENQELENLKSQNENFRNDNHQKDKEIKSLNERKDINKKEIEDLKERRSITVEKDEKKKPLPFDYWDKDLLNKYYSDLKNIFDDCNKGMKGFDSGNGFIQIIYNFLRCYRHNIRKTVIDKLLKKMSFEEEEKIGMNCLCVSINIINLKMDQIEEIILYELFDYLNDFRQYSHSSAVARRMTETILYCFCNYCYSTNIRKNKEINFSNTNKKCLKECFDNPPTDKIKLAAAIIICYFKLERDNLSRSVEMYLRDIKEKHFLKSSERYLGIKEELITVALDKNKDVDQKRTQSKMRLKEEEFDYTKMSKQEIYETLEKKSLFFKLLETKIQELKYQNENFRNDNHQKDKEIKSLNERYKKEVEDLKEQRSITVEKDEKKKPLPFDYWDKDLLNKYYSDLKNIFDDFNKGMKGFDSGNGFIQIIYNFLRCYRHNIRKTVIDKLLNKMSFEEEEKIGMNCLCVSINIINLKMDQIEEIILYELFDYLNDFRQYSQSSAVARRMTETILYCFCNYCDWSNTEENNQIALSKNTKSFLKECFNDLHSNKIKLSSAIVICFLVPINEELYTSARSYLIHIDENNLTNSVEMFLGIKKELIQAAIHKVESFEQRDPDRRG